MKCYLVERIWLRCKIYWQKYTMDCDSTRLYKCIRPKQRQHRNFAPNSIRWIFLFRENLLALVTINGSRFVCNDFFILNKAVVDRIYPSYHVQCLICLLIARCVFVASNDWCRRWWNILNSISQYSISHQAI